MTDKNIIEGGQIPLDFDSTQRGVFFNQDSQKSTNVVNLFSTKIKTTDSRESVTSRLLREAQQLDW